MQPHSSPESPFSLTFDNGNHHNLLQILKQPLEKALYLKECENIYSSISYCNDALSFIRSLLSVLNVRAITTEDRIANVPSQGPAIVIANHPFGAIEGLILARLLCTLRPDVKVMANFLLLRIPQLKELFIPVNPFTGGNAIRRNIRPMREAIRWVQNGHMLVVFPAGEVSHFKPGRGEISDPRWNPGIVKIIRKTGAPVLPAFFKGANSPFFQIAGLLHPKLRTAMLAREFLNKRRKTIELKIGRLIPYNRLERFLKDGDLLDYLRWRTYLLGHTALPSKKSMKWPIIPSVKTMKPIGNPRPVDDLADEINQLPVDQQLATSGDYVVWHAEACRIPCLLQEIGRLREISFRAANEGTGKTVDLDRFDSHYHHLFIWHRKNRETCRRIPDWLYGHTPGSIRNEGPLYIHPVSQQQPPLRCDRPVAGTRQVVRPAGISAVIHSAASVVEGHRHLRCQSPPLSHVVRSGKHQPGLQRSLPATHCIDTFEAQPGDRAGSHGPSEITPQDETGPTSGGRPSQWTTFLP